MISLIILTTLLAFAAGFWLRGWERKRPDEVPDTLRSGDVSEWDTMIQNTCSPSEATRRVEWANSELRVNEHHDYLASMPTVSLPVLPIDHDDEAIVDALLRRRNAERRIKPLEQRFSEHNERVGSLGAQRKI